MDQRTSIKLAAFAAVVALGVGTLHADKMYWVDRGALSLQRAELNGADVEVILAAELGWPSGVALDVTAGKVYWTDWALRKIQRSNLDGTDVERLIDIAIPGSARGIALDLVAGKMYWTDALKVFRANLDGSAVEEVVALSSPASLRAIALDVGAGKMYLTDHGHFSVEGDERILRANLDGSMMEDLPVAGLGFPYGIALDVPAGKMYWMEINFQRIKRANLDGSGAEDFLVGVSGSELAIDSAAHKLYWTTWNTGSIHKANLNSGAYGTIVAGLGNIGYIDVDPVGGKMYWFNFTADAPRMQRASLDGTNMEDLVANTAGLVNPWALAVDDTGRKIYWSDAQTSQIFRADQDGANVEAIATHPVGHASHGISLDLAAGKIYWTEWQAGVRRANLDGSFVEDLVTGPLHLPWGIDLDLSGGKMYWIDKLGVDAATTNIFRANLDGSAVEEVLAVEPSVMDIAIDDEGRKMYWTDNYRSIYRANLDGTDMEEIAANDVAADALGIDLDLSAGKVYWSTWANPPSVRRANLDGTDVEELITTADGAVHIHGMALGSSVGLPIPAVSTWGMIVMVLLLLSSATLVLTLRRRSNVHPAHASAS